MIKQIDSFGGTFSIIMLINANITVKVKSILIH